MASYSDTIADSLHLIGVLAETDSISAEQAADGLVTLNDLMAAWENLGINVGHVPSATPSDTMVYPANARLAIKAGLAMALCADYGRSPPPIVVAMASSAFSHLAAQSVYQNAPITNLDTLSAQRSVSFIESGP